MVTVNQVHPHKLNALVAIRVFSVNRAQLVHLSSITDLAFANLALTNQKMLTTRISPKLQINVCINATKT